MLSGASLFLGSAQVVSMKSCSMWWPAREHSEARAWAAGSLCAGPSVWGLTKRLACRARPSPYGWPEKQKKGLARCKLSKLLRLARWPAGSGQLGQ